MTTTHLLLESKQKHPTFYLQCRVFLFSLVELLN